MHFSTSRIRAQNALGQSEWSNPVKLKPLKKPCKPWMVSTVSGHRKITVLWMSDDAEFMEQQHIAKHFKIISDPQTREHQMTKKGKTRIEFQALDNEQMYRFQVVAVNENFKIESEWTERVKPQQNREDHKYKKSIQEKEEEHHKVALRKRREQNRTKTITNRSNFGQSPSARSTTPRSGSQRTPRSGTSRNSQSVKMFTPDVFSDLLNKKE